MIRRMSLVALVHGLGPMAETETYTAPAYQWVLGGLGVFLPIALGIGFIRRQKRRLRDSVKQFADVQGWTYAPQDDAVLQYFAGWPFNLGFNHQAKEVVRGTYQGRYATAFHFSFVQAQVGVPFLGLARGALGGLTAIKSRQPRSQDHAQGADIFGGLDPTLVMGSSARGFGASSRVWTLCALRLPAPLPPVMVRVKQPVLDSFLALANGGLEVGDEEFDRSFLVRAEFPAMARDLLTPVNRELLLNFNSWSAAKRGGPRSFNGATPGLSLHLWTSGTSLLALTAAPQNEQGLGQCFELMNAFLNNVPAEVWKKAEARVAVPPSRQSAPMGPRLRVPPPPPPPPAPSPDSRVL